MRLLAFAAVLGLAACRDGTGVGIPAVDLRVAHQRWSAEGIHDYSFQLQRSCECLGTNPLLVTVFGDTVYAVQDLTHNESVDRKLGLTVEGLFAVIDDAIQRGTPVEATYDSRLGYPIQIIYDGPALPVDGGIVYTASNLVRGFIVAPTSR